MDPALGSRLVESVLDTAGSMQRLVNQLDHISLHQEEGISDQCCKSKKSKRNNYKPEKLTSVSSWPAEETLSRGDSTPGSYDRSPSQRSNNSSKFDSAIGSLHSQTDDSDSLQSQSPPPHTLMSFSYGEQLQRYSHHSTTFDPHAATVYWSEFRHSPQIVSWRRAKELAASKQRTGSPKKTAPSTNMSLLNATIADLDSTSSSPSPRLSRTVSSRTSRVLPTPPRPKPSCEQLRELMERQTMSHKKLQVQKDDRKLQRDEGGGMESGSSSSTITGTPEITQPKKTEQQPLQSMPEAPKIPTQNATSVEEAKHSSAWVRVHRDKRTPNHSPTTRRKLGRKSDTSPAVRKRSTAREITEEVYGQTTRFYHESITPQASPHLPRRYQPSLQRPQQCLRDNNATSNHDVRKATATAQENNASFLQRVRRRKHGSFKRDRKPKRRSPVKRSFSDRITYRDRKEWVDYEEELYPISSPSFLRPIGRMVDTHTTNLHVVELHKLPNGKYGIYITEGVTGGVFISRFAGRLAEKFYSGLLAPGDEIIAVNREVVKDKSIDYVQNLLATLNSAVLSIVPVSSRPDWCW